MTNRFIRSIFRDLASATAALWDTDEDGIIINPCWYCKLPWRDCKCENGGFPVKNDLRVEGGFAWKDEWRQPHILMNNEFKETYNENLIKDRRNIQSWIHAKSDSLFGENSFESVECARFFLEEACYKNREEVFGKWAQWEKIYWIPGLKKAIKAGMDFKVLPPQMPTDEHTTS